MCTCVHVHVSTCVRAVLLIVLLGKKPVAPILSIVRVKFVWNGTKANHLSLIKDQIVQVKEQGDEGWWLGQCDGKVSYPFDRYIPFNACFILFLKIGWFPCKFVEEIEPDSLENSALTPLPPIPEVTEMYKAIYSYQSNNEGDICFPEGAIITVLRQDGDWWQGEYNGNQGMFPSNYVSPLSDEPNTADMDTLGVDTLGVDTLGLSGGDSTTPKGSRKHPLLGRVIVGFTGIEEGQLSLIPGQLVLIRRQESNGWWEGQLQARGEERRHGWFPANRIELMTAAMSGQTVSPKPDTPTKNMVSCTKTIIHNNKATIVCVHMYICLSVQFTFSKINFLIVFYQYRQ